MAGDDRVRTAPPRPLFSVAEAADLLGGRLLSGPGTDPIEVRPAAAEAMITGVESDSRYVRPGDLFCALPGERVDGHRFVGAAFAAGAVAALVADVAATGGDRPVVDPASAGPALIVVDDVLAGLIALARHHRRRFHLNVVGVTGSVGKTTTKDLIAGTLRARFRVLANRGNLNTDIGLALTLLELGPEHEIACLEMGMRGPGEIRRLAEVAEPSIAVLTNIGPIHIELLGSIEAIARAKEELIDGLPANGTAVLNVDDPRLAAMARAHRDRLDRVVTYGISSVDADLQGRLLGDNPAGGTRFEVILDGTARELAGGPGRLAPFAVPLEGRHSVLNALAALAVGLTLGMSPDEMREGLGRSTLSAMRQEVCEVGGIRIINDAYNAGPASMEAALELVACRRGQRGGRAVAVLGDMLELGSLAEEAHREVGRKVAALDLDLVIIVGPLGAIVAEEAVRAGLPPSRVLYRPANSEAAEAALEALAPGDTVLLKASRGMRFEEIAARLVDGLQAGSGGGEREQS